MGPGIILTFFHFNDAEKIGIRGEFQSHQEHFTLRFFLSICSEYDSEEQGAANQRIYIS